jgi:hypothetical protein
VCTKKIQRKKKKEKKKFFFRYFNALLASLSNPFGVQRATFNVQRATLTGVVGKSFKFGGLRGIMYFEDKKGACAVKFDIY